MRQALELALEALEDYVDEYGPWSDDSGAQYVLRVVKEALAQPEQEPVAYLSNKRQRLNIELKPQTFVEIPTVTDWEMPLYMKPPQRTWVGLTDEEIDQGLLRTNYAMHTAGAWRDGVEWAQSQLKEKNHANGNT